MKCNIEEENEEDFFGCTCTSYGYCWICRETEKDVEGHGHNKPMPFNELINNWRKRYES